MPKVKTHQGAKKRIRLTGTGKAMHRTAGQSHFNSRDTGNATKNKRRDSSLAGVNFRVKKALSK